MLPKFRSVLGSACLVLFASAIAAACGGDSSAADLRAIGTRCPNERLESLSPSVVLATRMMLKDSDELRLNEGRRDELAGEIEQVLAAVEEEYPAVRDVRPWQRYFLGEVTVGLEPPLLEDVTPFAGDLRETINFVTGNVPFDDLNSELGLRSVRVYEYAFALLCFDEVVNPRVASSRYESLEGVKYAELTPPVGDGSDIALAHDGDDWYVAVRVAGGDCPAGCTEEELSYFRVADGEATRLDSSQASEFDGLTKEVRHRSP